MGIDTELIKVFSFIYETEFTNGLFEYEYDHVFLAQVALDINISPKLEEISVTKWQLLDDCIKHYQEHSEIYTPWFLPAAEIVLRRLYPTRSVS